MKKRCISEMIICSILLVLILFSGCAKQEKEDARGGSSTVSGDYPYYSTWEELYDASGMICEGTVVDISFEAFDVSGFKPVSESTKPENIALMTLYTVRVDRSFKGDEADEITVRCYGEPALDESLREKRQEALQKVGASESNVVFSETEIYSKGQTYLFFLKKGNVSYYFTVSPVQGGVSKDSALFEEYIQKFKS